MQTLQTTPLQRLVAFLASHVHFCATRREERLRLEVAAAAGGQTRLLWADVVWFQGGIGKSDQKPETAPPGWMSAMAKFSFKDKRPPFFSLGLLEMSSIVFF